MEARRDLAMERLSELLHLALSSHESGGPKPRGVTTGLLEVLAQSPTIDDDLHEIVLRLLEPRGRRGTRTPRTTEPLITFACANCDGPVGETPWLYCSSFCADEAKTIRYARAVTVDGRICRDPTVAQAVRIRIGHVLNGGYDADARQLSGDTRALVLERDGGRCQRCGHPGNEVDHIRPDYVGDINHVENLRVLCSDCHRAKTLATFRPI